MSLEEIDEESGELREGEEEVILSELRKTVSAFRTSTTARPVKPRVAALTLLRAKSH